MVKTFQYENYIFDLYGTLVDIRTNEKKTYLWQKMALYMSLQGASYAPPKLRREYARLWDEIRKNNRQTLLENMRFSKNAVPPLEEIEISMEELIQKLYAAKQKSASREMITAWALAFRTLSLEHLSLYEGAARTLETLKNQGKRLYLLSNAQRLFTEPEMRSLGIYELFDDVFYSSDIGFMKPSPHFYGALLQKHGLDAASSVMIGNDPDADAWGAFHMGMDSMYIHTAQSPRGNFSLPPDCRRLNSIEEV